ncbi:hypothetical protein BOSE62_40336 [Bosea sp. 62]|nr:hypothetical protein BOSE46_120451 [Bosea sp. 46]CAD5262424.1 hypothetical protein BOSE21B_110680 [Bosea sp. 21B]CAD5278038.1 hypothetical protein BOSE7B_40537 [Bosea sp. 7B]VVT58723.1 hypothetical protein BOS5A_200728 [Bosea sp. EC-HK365B]VXB59423.1 hypothetical protein BOSE29B_110615 [Bosea sp. 29B]VXC00407.1 hypothetical protein BOSE125_160407 [Bosea sp. 125]VXC40355.1 hypothetical protein BOSE62_40336 [Bosea sp. 62]VXC80323.1 hypothetical protein BOSE127_50245 [Bosea sp. 127]
MVSSALGIYQELATILDRAANPGGESSGVSHDEYQRRWGLSPATARKAELRQARRQ